MKRQLIVTLIACAGILTASHVYAQCGCSGGYGYPSANYGMLRYSIQGPAQPNPYLGRGGSCCGGSAPVVASAPRSAPRPAARPRPAPRPSPRTAAARPIPASNLPPCCR